MVLPCLLGELVVLVSRLPSLPARPSLRSDLLSVLLVDCHCGGVHYFSDSEVITVAVGHIIV